MGIQGLLPLLKSIMVPIHVKDLEGCSVAVDTYSWLHKGALCCSKDLCLGQPTSKHINYCMHRVNLLRHHGLRPILVFDGGFLPMKTEQENKRARARKENLARALEHESCGNSPAAYEYYQKAVDISPSVAYDLIQVLKQENVSYVVAPYEADAQMTFLAVSKQVDAVITEDSDLIAFGCPRIIYKMDKFGQGVEFRYSMLQQNRELNFTGFTKQMLLEMCILSGCDYLQSLPGMGLKKAHALVKKFKSYDKVIKHLKYNSSAVSPLYEESFKKAILTFQHQRVYDPITEDIVHLSNPSDNMGEDLDFLGPSIPQHIAKGIASGDLDPFTKSPFEGECARTGLVLDETCPLKNLKPKGERKKLDLPAQKNLLTNYFYHQEDGEAQRVLDTILLYFIEIKNTVLNNEHFTMEGFASLEAKRKFRVPRITPKHPNSKNETPSPGENINEEDNSCKINCSPPTLSSSGNLGIVAPAKDSVDIGVATTAFVFSESPSHGLHDKEYLVGDMKSPQHTSLQQPRNSIHPCIELRKGHVFNSASDAGEGKIRIQSKNVIVRSSHFQHKSMNENDKENKNEKLLVKDDASTGVCESAISEYESKSALDVGGETGTEDRNIITSSSYFQHKSIKGNDQGKTRVENKRVIVRSSYFQQKSSKENCQDNKNEKLVAENGVATDICENTIDDTDSLGSNYFKGTIIKRKFGPVDCVETEKLNHKYMRTDGSLPIQSNFTSNLDDSVAETKDEQDKFGCNISHLGQYSDIAEKSMEKFVSVISSFRCSSGSRASGLRAPLKDVQNTCTTRSTNGMDLSKFAYVPTKRKASSASRRV